MSTDQQLRPDFTRFQVALAGGRPDRVPMAEVGIAPELKAAFLGHPICSLQDEVAFWREAGYDYVLLGRTLGLSLFPGISYGRPIGAAGGRAWASESAGPIATPADFEAYPWPDPDQADYSEFKEIGGCLPAGMRVIAYLGPVFQWVWMLMGFERFCYALGDDRDFLARMFARVGQIRLAVMENILACCGELGAVWMLDDIAYNEGMMISPAVWRRYALPWLRDIAGLARQQRLPLIYHSDGVFWDVLDEILSLGVCAIHPIEPKGMGEDLARLRGRLASRACLVGGIDLDTLIRRTPADVVAETRRVLNALAPAGGYVAGSSNTLTADVPVANYRAMLETIARCAY
jgi:uroporphyrinogen decarboxylase